MKLNNKETIDKIIISKIILSKIIIELLNNYKQSLMTTEYDNEELINQIEKVKKENINIIDKNIKIFNEISCLDMKIENIIDKKIDLLYIEIINSLIKKRLLENYEYSININKSIEF